MTRGFTQLVAYSGEDELQVNACRIQVRYVAGFWKPRVYHLRISLKDDRQHLNIAGPTLPTQLPAFDQVQWVLPRLAVQPGMQETIVIPDVGGTILLGASSALLLDAEVLTSAWRSAKRSQLLFGHSIVLRRSTSRAARHVVYKNLNELYTSAGAPDELKHLLAFWRRVDLPASHPKLGEGEPKEGIAQRSARPSGKKKPRRRR